MNQSTVLRELPKSDVINAIGDQLDRLAKLYQVPNWDAMNTVLLSEWIVETYQSDQLKTVMTCLSRPRGTEKVWRLTPDTIREWMALELERLAERREKYIHNAKHEEVKSEWTDERLAELKKIAEAVEDFKIPSLTKEDIEKEGQEKPIVKPPILPLSEIDIEIRTLAQKFEVTEYQMKQLRIRWGKECFDILTGKKLPDWIPFEKWLTIPE